MGCLWNSLFIFFPSRLNEDNVLYINLKDQKQNMKLHHYKKIGVKLPNLLDIVLGGSRVRAPLWPELFILHIDDIVITWFKQ